MYNKKRILVIAGSDSSGGAGLEADQKVITTHGCYAMTATTALTAQNTLGVTDIHVVPTDFVEKQLNAVIDDVGVDIVKTGMLASGSTVKMVAKILKNKPVPFNIIDPVMVATSGAKLLPDDAIQTLISDLLPVTDLLTPNIPEASLILEKAGQPTRTVTSIGDLKHLAQALATLGPRHVLVKGGHLPMPKTTSSTSEAGSDSSDKAIFNVLYSTTTHTHQVFTSPYLASRNTHGTGCSLASAIAATLLNSLPALPPSRTSLDLALPTAIASSLQYITHSIATSLPLGAGAGPINHFSLQRSLPFVPGFFTPYLLSQPAIAPLWTRFTHHPFVARLGAATLPLASYRHYMRQDYAYLRHYARAHALAAYKAPSLAQSAASARIVLHVERETALHVAECRALGVEVGVENVDGVEEDVATLAYSRWLLDTGCSGDWFGLQVALLPCLVGYGVVAARLHAERAARELHQAPGAGRQGDAASSPSSSSARDSAGNKGEGAAAAHYARWIDNYVADDYVEAVRVGQALVEEHAPRQSPERVAELVGVFATATKMETAFWDMALRHGDEGGGTG